jgi:hypothetical protein
MADPPPTYPAASLYGERNRISTHQYARLVHRWVDSIGLETISYGTHSMRRP